PPPARLAVHDDIEPGSPWENAYSHPGWRGFPGWPARRGEHRRGDGRQRTSRRAAPGRVRRGTPCRGGAWRRGARGWWQRGGAGSAWENAYSESFNGRLTDEVLDREVYTAGATYASVHRAGQPLGECVQPPRVAGRSGQVHPAFRCLASSPMPGETAMSSAPA